MDILRAFNYKVSVDLGATAFEKMSRAFPQLNNLPSLQRINTRIAHLSGIMPVSYHCCINSCCCFTGPYTELNTCPYCDETRYQSNGQPRNILSYLPLIPRLINYYANEKMANTMQYRHDYHSKPSVTADVFDGENYRNLCKEPVTLDGKPLGHRFFSQPTDIALGLSTDGFGPFKRRKHTCWPIIGFNYNLPLDIRYRLENLIPFGLIPGPKAPKDFDSFLRPLIEELRKLMEGVPAFDVRFLRR